MKKVSFIIALCLCSIIVCAKSVQRPTSYNYQRGLEALFTDHDYQAALDYLNKELEDHPKDGYTHAWIAHIRLELEEYGRALTCANSAIKLLPKADKEYLVFAYTTRGSVYENLHDTAAAIADYTQAIKLDPTIYKSYEHRADLYFYQRKFTLADADYRKMTQLDDNTSVILGYMGLGRNLRDQERHEEAIQMYSKVITLYGDSYSSSYSFRAESLLKLKRYEEAVSDIVKALEIDNDNKAFWMMISLEPDEAVELMKQRLKLQNVFSPNQPTWPYYMAVLAEANNNYRDAIDAYKRTNKISRNSQTDERIALCYEALGDYSMALQYINYAIDADSTRSEYFYDRANAYAELGRIDKSIEDMSRFIELRPKSDYGYYRRGWWKHLLLQCDDALEDFYLSKAINPSYTYIYDGIARCYWYMGDTLKARAEYASLLKFDTIPDGNSCANFAYHFLGQDDKAIEWMEKILQNDSTQTYDAACTYSLVGDTAKALEYLQKAFDKGFVRFHHLEVDTDLDNIRNLVSYKKMVEAHRLKVLSDIEKNATDTISTQQVVEVPFTSANGVTKVDCTINGLPLNFVFDTGASDVSLSQVEANFMFKNGYLNDKDIIGKQHYQTADGSISVGTIINLRKINFGGLELSDVRASVVKSQSAPLLLGQSILQRLGKIEIDNTKRCLKITTH